MKKGTLVALLLALPLPLVAGALVASGRGDARGARPPPETDPWLDGTALSRPPNSLMGLPGGSLTYAFPSETPRTIGSWLAEDDALYRPFQERAATALQDLTFRDVRILDSMAADPGLRGVWDGAVRKVLVSGSHERAGGGWEIVLQASLHEVYLRLR